MSTNDSAHWRGSIADLSRATPEDLFEAPLFVVEHDPLPNKWVSRACKHRTSTVGKQVAKIFSGAYKHEGDLPVFSGVAEHFDGVHIPRYAQINTTYPHNAQDKTGKGGATQFTLRRRSFSPFTLTDYYPEPIRSLEEDEKYANSCLIFSRYSDRLKPSLDEIAKSEDLPLPSTAREWTITIPIGATAVFLNGSGLETDFFTHQTRSWHAESRETNFLRIAELGRVVSDRFAVLNP